MATNKSSFFINLLAYSKAQGYSFLVPNEQFDANKPSARTQLKQNLLMAATVGVMGAVMGMNTRVFFGNSNSAQLSQNEKDALAKDLTELQNHCDFAGIKLDNGPANLRLAIDADNLSDESLIGRSAIIHQRTHDFLKYTSYVMYDTKYGASTHLMIVFSSHKRVEEFWKKYANKCHHKSFLKKVYTRTWVVDLENKEITRQGYFLSDLLGQGLDKMEAEIFK